MQAVCMANEKKVCFIVYLFLYYSFMKLLIPLLVLLVASWCTMKEAPLATMWANDWKVCFGETCLVAEIADDAEERRVGLMNRESLKDNEGMLFVFDAPKSGITFWMKNTLIPLDMIRMDSSWHVLYMEQDVQPCINEPCPTYGSKLASIISKYVLELNAWKIEEYKIEVGQIATISD